jgi:hypothetical protein
MFKIAGGGITNHVKACARKQQDAQANEEIYESAFHDEQGKNDCNCSLVMDFNPTY